MEIAFSNSWQEKICNDTTTFAETFRIPLNSGVNITALQHDLCADLSRQDSAIRDILNRLNMKDVFKAVCMKMDLMCVSCCVLYLLHLNTVYFHT